MIKFTRRKWSRWTCNRPKYKFKRRRALPYHLVLRCRRRKGNKPPVWFDESLGFVEYCCANPFSSYVTRKPKEVSSKTISEFLSNFDVLKFYQLYRKLSGLTIDQHRDNATRLLHQAATMYRVGTDAHALQAGFKNNYHDMPLVYDTGASYGLTPFRADFIDYKPCDIPIKDITKINRVKGIGTVMYKFVATNGDILFLPGLAYHLESADIRLFSPQTYHQLYGGDSILNGDRVLMQLRKQTHLQVRHDIDIPIDINNTNLPLIHHVACSEAEKKNIGPSFRTAISASFLCLGFFGVWKSVVDEFEYEFNSVAQMMCPCVGTQSNTNLTSAQKELLLWHWKLGISMHHVQKLMKGHTATDPYNKSVYFPPVIHPKFASAATCPVPACEVCSLARAKRRSPQVVRQEAVKEKEAILAWDKYEAGDFVSMDQFIVKTPGRLLEGFGREGANNRFHGGTIFNDAATGILWVENQVSLGAGETILAKESFEQWLRETAGVEIKHLHSDNGVFNANEFVADCKDKDQSQSFSGVGAQHQNAKAERAIQTVMWMARSFMLHVSMHWSERGVDDIALWGFAVKHATWLYNRIPNRYTGVTPLELLTKTKADHRDLSRTHVWGCPVYVLDPALQDNKKIPKWNKRARQAQFVGFSEQHSSLVAKVRHLVTGHISPQYHVVFDDLFQTVFNDAQHDEVTDAICKELFEDSRDIYVEPEYDDDGHLVYSPPPLDEIWLTEPERRERKQRLRDQRLRNQEIMREKAHSIPPTLPDPSPSRNLPQISDDERSVESASSPQHRDEEPEGDGWQPQQDLIDDDESIPPQPPSPPLPGNNDNVIPDDASSEDRSIDSEGAVQPPRRRRRRHLSRPRWQRSDSGRLERRVNFSRLDLATKLAMARDSTVSLATRAQAILSLSASDLDHLHARERKQYAVSLGPKDPSPMARRLARKRLTNRQRRRRLRQYGDLLLFTLSDQVPSVEELMQSPLSRFIHLAANDCGYNGSKRELICEVVHPLFLRAKAAASKADNPSWREAMSSPEADQWMEACKIEVGTLEGMDSWEVVDRSDSMKVLPSTWAFRIKRYPDGLIKKLKARFCARGDQQVEGIDFFETYAPVVQMTTIRLMLILEVMLNLKSKQGDVTAAFLHGELEEGEEVYLEMPRGFKQEGKVLKLKRTLYGLRQSPRAFWKYIVKKMEECGMEQSNLDPCLFLSGKVIAITYVDDILFWARDEKDIHDLAMKLREVGVDLEEEEDAAGFLGVTLDRNDDGSIELKQTGLIDRIIEALGLDDGNVHGKWTPAELKPLVKDADGEPAREGFSFAAVVGMLLYLTGHSRPEMSYAVNCAARYMFAPKHSHEQALKRIGRYLKATRDRGMVLNPSGNVLKIDCYPDADFAGMYGHEKSNDPACVKSRTGYVITAANCPVHWQSKLQGQTAGSTMEAEINALAHSCRELFPIMDMLKSLCGILKLPDPSTAMHVSIHEDNAGALVLAETLPPQFTPRSKHYAIKTIWFREEIVRRGIKLFKIDTKEQLGDLFTKSLPKVIFEYLRKKLIGW